MKYLKWIGLILLVLVAVSVLVMVLLPKSMEVSRTITIDAETKSVYSLVASHKARNTWSPWAAMDSSMTYDIEGEDGTEGATMTWVGPKAGKGSATTTLLEPGKVEQRLIFTEPYKWEALEEMTVEQEGTGSRVTWNFSMDMPMPWNLLSRVFGWERGVKKDFDDGLARLKALAEAVPKPIAIDGYTIKKTDLNERHYLTVRSRISWDEISGFYGSSYGAMMAAVNQYKVALAGPPSGIYYEWNEDQRMTDLAAALPLDGIIVNPPDGMTIVTLQGAAISTDYYGPYESSAPAYHAMDAFMEQEGLTFRNIVIEEYITDPGMEPDTAKWHTRIYFLVEE